MREFFKTTLFKENCNNLLKEVKGKLLIGVTRLGQILWHWYAFHNGAVFQVLAKTKDFSWPKTTNSKSRSRMRKVILSENDVDVVNYKNGIQKVN